MPYATLYDATADGFDFRGLLPILGCALVVLAVGVVAWRRSAGRPIRWLVLGVGATALTVALVGVAIDYRNFRLDLEDLRAGRAAVVEGLVEHHELRHGGEHFRVDSIRLYTRTTLGGYGMSKGAVVVEESERVRIHYSLRTHRRRHVVLRFAAAPAG
jgi:hypothetical protein